MKQNKPSDGVRQLSSYLIVTTRPGNRTPAQGKKTHGWALHSKKQKAPREKEAGVSVGTITLKRLKNQENAHMKETTFQVGGHPNIKQTPGEKKKKGTR